MTDMVAFATALMGENRDLKNEIKMLQNDLDKVMAENAVLRAAAGSGSNTNPPNTGRGGGSGSDTNPPNTGRGGGSGSDTNPPNTGRGGGRGGGSGSDTNPSNTGRGGGRGSNTNPPNTGSGSGSNGQNNDQKNFRTNVFFLGKGITPEKMENDIRGMIVKFVKKEFLDAGYITVSVIENKRGDCKGFIAYINHYGNEFVTTALKTHITSTSVHGVNLIIRDSKPRSGHNSGKASTVPSGDNSGYTSDDVDMYNGNGGM